MIPYSTFEHFKNQKNWLLRSNYCIQEENNLHFCCYFQNCVSVYNIIARLEGPSPIISEIRSQKKKIPNQT